jgi:sec-independent protein translocase protein TatA
MDHPILAWLPHGTDFIWLFLLAVLLFGADKLPKLAKGLGKSLGEFKKAKEDFEKEIHSASNDPEKPAQQNLISGNVPQPVTPVNTATSVDELTKKI